MAQGRFQPKYYDKIIAAQKAPRDPHDDREFDFNDLAGSGGIAGRLLGRLIESRLLYWFLRTFWPVAKLGSFCLVTRYHDVKEVLEKGTVFEAPFKLEMPELAGGTNFLLGMPPGKDHERQAQLIRKAMPADDIKDILEPAAAEMARELIAVSGGRIDAIEDLLTPVVTECCALYFGFDIQDRKAFAEWAMAVSQLLFGDPLGDPKSRRLALLGAEHMRDTVIRPAIGRAHVIAGRIARGEHAKLSDGDRRLYASTLVGRMVAMQIADRANGPSNGEITAMLLGLCVGFVPTITLGAGNIIEVLMSNPSALAAAQKAAREGDDRLLSGILFEAMRFKAPLTPGSFRYAAEDCKLRWHKISKGTTVIAATASAMFDRRGIESPGKFDPEREQKKDLLFGGMGATHYCLGEHVAKAVVTQIYKPLLQQKSLARDAGRKGKLHKIGAFPRNLVVSFEPDVGHRFQSMVTICLPVTTGATAAKIDAAIDALGNPANVEVAAALKATERVHFASICAIRADDSSDRATHLVVELNVDGPEASAIHAIAAKAGHLLLPVFRTACGLDKADGLASLLVAHVVKLKSRPWDVSGLNFPGTPELSVPRIEKERSTADRARTYLHEFLGKHAWEGPLATSALAHVRNKMRENGKGAVPLRLASEKLAVARRDDLGTLEAIKSLLSDRAFMKKVGLAVLVAWLVWVLWRQDQWGTGILSLLSGDTLLNALVVLWRLAVSLVYGGLALLAAFVVAGIAKLFMPRRDEKAALKAERAQKQKEKAAAGRWWLRPALLVLGAGLLHFIFVSSDTGIASWARLDGWERFKDVLALACSLVGSLLSSTLVLAGLVAAIAGALVWWLRRNERDDKVEDLDPDPAHVRELMSRENKDGFIQNHLIAVTELKKPRALRRLTLAAAFWGIEKLVMHRFRPGFVLDIGTIHFARWFRLPGTDKLIFLSNYDGSWESYLEDFCTKAHLGQTAVWSNGFGFPSARYLLFDGAKDGDRFKRWVRRQQAPSRFWYTRFPELTTDLIRNNALICDGLARARTESEARGWLDLFNSRPRPLDAMETHEIQSLVFGPMGSLLAGEMIALRFPENADRCRRWLRDIMAMQEPNDAAVLEAAGIYSDGPLVAFGDVKPDDRALIVAFSPRGLRHLGLHGLGPTGAAADKACSFPSVFIEGMTAPHRSRLLGDQGPSAPSTWEWARFGNGPEADETPDAVLLVYAKDGPLLKSFASDERNRLGRHGLREVGRVRMHDLVPRQPSHEPFGFRDGVSQPVIRGSKRFHKGVEPIHVVAPGEIVLGYKDNRGYFPTSPLVAAEDDCHNCLPAVHADLPGQFPDYSGEQTRRSRDFGRNGSYLVIRQLEQDAAGFTAFCREMAQDLCRTYQSLNIDGDWVAAKMVGRWQDGSSLVRYPDPLPKKAAATAAACGKAQDADDRPREPDNDYWFGIDDPQGLRCPYGSHVRRVNPRDSFQPGSKEQLEISNRHRILRVGRPYAQGEDGGGKAKGLLFMCLNADIERQFEFIQQTWVVSSAFHGLQHEVDPIVVGSRPNGGSNFTIPTTAGPMQLKGLNSYVTVRGGGYFFMPSRSALRYLAMSREK